MRFVENGPAIPDRLLRARDEGQVVFFCGAGVSRARAGLHDFSGLANAVADSLGSARGSAARTLIDAAAAQLKMQGLGSLLPTDRVFSLLEREFEVEDVRNAVAQALQYSPDVDRSAHQILLDLARGPDGTVRLVTTNFDHLFEEQDPSVDRHIPPLLPRPNRPQEWGGVVYLHGRLGDGFNPDLEPETAETWTAGFDYRPDSGLVLSASYFDTAFGDQIARPTSGNLSNVLSDPALAPFVRFIDPAGDPADLALVQSYVTAPGFGSGSLYPWAGRRALGEDPGAGLPLFKEIVAAMDDRKVWVMTRPPPSARRSGG